MGVKLHACLLALGYTDEEIATLQWDHFPALGLRQVVDGKMVPDPNDPHYIQPLTQPAHDRKTNGTKATTAGSDKHMIAKTKRLEDDRREFQRRMGMNPAERKAEKRSRWPRRRFAKKGKDHG